MLRFDLKDVSRKEAKMILKYMQEVIDKYGFVTLADFYDLADFRKCSYRAHKKGWRSLTGARISLIKRKGNYRIKLPNFEELS